MAACPSCRSTIHSGDRFCSSCGHPLEGSVPASGRRVEYRLVTALYVDMVGSTRLAEELDPEDLSAVVNAVQEAVRSEVTDRGGSIGAFVGDGVLGVFGLPVAFDDDPVRALRAAESILDRVRAIDEHLGSRLSVDIDVRIGVASGEILAPISDDLSVGTLAGDVLNVAARLQELAPSGGIVATQRTSRSASSFRFEDLGLLDIRGRARPIHAFVVRGEAETAGTSFRAPLHGREAEQAQLRDAYQRVVAEGEPRSVTIIGNAGVGKSRLVREFIAWAEQMDPSLTTLSGRCLPYGEDINYRPFAEMLADLTGVTSNSDPVDAARQIEVLVAAHVTEEDAASATEALMRMIGLRPPVDTAMTPRRIRELLRTTWRSIIAGLASDGPVLLLVEDLHWAGDALLDLLDHVIRRATGPLLVLEPARPEFVAAHPEWLEGFEGSEQVALEPLEAAEAERLAAHLLAEAGLPVAESERIIERAGGNPFFIEELARELQLRRSDGHSTDPGDDLPATIQGVLSARIDLLQPGERRALQAASVVGRFFTAGAIEAITGIAEPSLGDMLRRLEGLQLVRLSGEPGHRGEAEYVFQHVLIREAAYARLSRRDLAVMHGLVADWLDQQGSEGAAESERLAFHTWRAHEMATATNDIPDAEISRLRAQAVDRLVRAARRARERAAFGRSRELAQLAASIADGPKELATTHEQLGLVALNENDGDAAWASLRQAVDLHLAASEPDHEAIAHAAALAVEVSLRWTGIMRQLPPMDEVLRYVDIGIEHAGSDDSQALAMLLTGLAFAPTTPGPQGASAREVITVDEGLAAGQRAREMAQRLGLPHVESAALDAIQTHALWGGRVQEAAEIITERLEIVDAVSDPLEVGDTYAMAAQLAYDFGRYTLARDRGLHGHRRTVDESPAAALHNMTWATLARVQIGEWDEVMAALAIAQDTLDRDRTPPHYSAPMYAAAAMVSEFRGRTGDCDRLLGILTEVWSTSDLASRGGHPLARWTRHTGSIYLRRGDFDTVRDIVVSTDAEPIGRESQRLAVSCAFIAATQEWDDADTVLDETRATASAYGLGALVAHADRLEGRASVAAGDRTGGLTLLTGARERFDSLGDHWEAAQTGIDIVTAGGDADPGHLLRFFETTGAIDEIGRVASLLPAV